MAETFPAGEGSVRVIAPSLSAFASRCSPTERTEVRVKLELLIEWRCLLFVGKQFRNKGLPAVLEALQEIDDDVFLLAIVAEDLVSEALELIRKHQLGARVRGRGTVSTMELAYCAADGLAHPTLEDTDAMVVLKAMSHGLPVIVSTAEFCGISAELNDGENALILDDPRLKNEFRGAIDRVFNDVGLSECLSTSGIDFARGRAWSEVVISYENFFLDSMAAG